MSTNCWWTPFPLNFWAGIRPHFLGRKAGRKKGLPGGQPRPFRRAPGAGLVGAAGRVGPSWVRLVLSTLRVYLCSVCALVAGEEAWMGSSMEAPGRRARVGRVVPVGRPPAGRSIRQAEAIRDGVAVTRRSGEFTVQRRSNTWPWFACVTCVLGPRRAPAGARVLLFTVSVVGPRPRRTCCRTGGPSHVQCAVSKLRPRAQGPLYCVTDCACRASEWSGGGCRCTPGPKRAGRDRPELVGASDGSPFATPLFGVVAAPT